MAVHGQHFLSIKNIGIEILIYVTKYLGFLVKRQICGLATLS